MACHWIRSRETENDTDETDPKDCDERDPARRETEVKRSLFEVAGVEQPDEDGEAVRNVETNRGYGSSGRESDRRPQGGDSEQERQEDREPNSPDGRLETIVDLVEEFGQAAVAAKAKHHAGIRGDGEETAVPDADHDEGHQRDSAIIAEDINEDLDDGLADLAADGIGKVLDGKEEGKEEEEAEEGGDADGR